MRKNNKQTSDVLEIMDHRYGKNVEWNRLVVEEELKASVGQLVHDLREEFAKDEIKLV